MTKITHKKTVHADNVKPKKLPEGANIYNVISPEIPVLRVNQNIQELRNAIRWAESILNPQRYNLYRTYVDAMQDSHIVACINTYKNLVLSREINFYKADGTINEETSKLLKTKWFRDFCSLALDSRFWGFSLIQLGDVTELGFKNVQLIPRIYVKPEFNIVTQSWSALVGQDFREEPYKNWVVPIGNPKDLGMLMQASYHAIWKKTALGAWAEYAQIFGVPTRILQTNTKDAETMKAADRMMKSWGPGQYVITNGQDKLEFKEANRSDASKVFKDLVDTANEEISKLILGGTGTMDEKSFVGSAKTHERILDKIKHDCTFFIEDIVMRQLLPILKFHGFDIPEDNYVKITDNQDLDIENKTKIVTALISSPNYKISAETFKKEFGLDIQEVEQETETEEKVKNNSIINELAIQYGLSYGTDKDL